MKKWQSISLVIGASGVAISLVVTTSIIASRLKLKTTKTSSFLNEHLALINGSYSSDGKGYSNTPDIHWNDGDIPFNIPINSVYYFGICYFYICWKNNDYYADNSKDYPPSSHSDYNLQTEHIGWYYELTRGEYIDTFYCW